MEFLVNKDMQNIEFVVRKLNVSEWEMAMQLAWDTFLVYEAPEYEKLGIDNFHDFVKGNELRELFLRGDYDAYGAFIGDVIVGIIGMRNQNHISLLFVEAIYHHQGIATKLIDTVKALVRKRGYGEMTVNSSPYAVSFYHKLGFKSLDKELKADGIRYTPMVMKV